MKGAIRVIAGLIITAGAVGGVEVSITDFELAMATLVAIGGLAIMSSGAKAVVAAHA